MTTHEQLEAEADELYPQPRDGVEFEYPIEALRFYERRAHVRAKTINAEQVEQAAWEHLRYTLTPNPSAARQSEWSRARRIVTTTFRAAGFLIEGARQA